MSSRAAVPWLVLLALLIQPAPAGAHAVLLKSSPAARAVLGQAPAQVILLFNERLEPAFSAVSVWTVDGAQVDQQDVTVGPENPRRLSVSLAPLAPGTYTVRFRVLSVDGHVTEGDFTFTVAP
jgi:methionine-rich copper-binding protein CopC